MKTVTKLFFQHLAVIRVLICNYGNNTENLGRVEDAGNMSNALVFIESGRCESNNLRSSDVQPFFYFPVTTEHPLRSRHLARSRFVDFPKASFSI